MFESFGAIIENCQSSCISFNLRFCETWSFSLFFSFICLFCLCFLEFCSRKALQFMVTSLETCTYSLCHFRQCEWKSVGFFDVFIFVSLCRVRRRVVPGPKAKAKVSGHSALYVKSCRCFLVKHEMLVWKQQFDFGLAVLDP